MTHSTVHSRWVPGPRRTLSKRVWPSTGVDKVFANGNHGVYVTPLSGNRFYIRVAILSLAKNPPLGRILSSS